MTFKEEYSVRELANNTSFRRMLNGKATSDEIERWNCWIEENDHNRTKAKLAISEIIDFEFKDPVFPDIEQNWANLFVKTVGLREKQSGNHRRRSNMVKLKRVISKAAVFLVMSMVGLGIYHFYDSYNDHAEQLAQETPNIKEKTVTTVDGEQKTLRFSDGSRVILNSNSTFTYSIDPRRQTINVTMEGEAYFEVKSGQSKEQPVFAVTTPVGIIRNIGTRFLVTIKDDWSRVVLEEGLVELEYAERDDLAKESRVLSVNKGEMVEFDRHDILNQETINTTFYTSWATGFMQFDQTELQEFADYVEQRFDVLVRIQAPELTDILLEGAVYFNSLESLVQSVSEVTGIPIYKSENRDIIYIGNTKECVYEKY